MVAYTGIQGQNILIVSSDPSNPTEGQIWYNSTSNLLKGYQFATVNAWASGGNLATARDQLAGAGTQTAALAFGGNPTSAATEEYNGTSWSGGGNLNNARKSLAGAGTQTAALAFGGTPPITGATELYNGTSWTSNPNSMSTARNYLAGCGTQTAGLAFGGNAPPATGATEEFTGPGTPVTQTITTS